jgi:hypothetical protein
MSSLPEDNNLVKEVRLDVSNVVYDDEFKYKDLVDGFVSKH